MYFYQSTFLKSKKCKFRQKLATIFSYHTFMKIIISIIILFFLGAFTYIYTWDVPAPEKEVKKEINILDFKK